MMLGRESVTAPQASTSGSPSSRCKTPRADDDLKRVFGHAFDSVAQSVPAGTVQYENPMHVHRAPKPGNSYRRVLFVSWDYNRFVNASLSTVFIDNWKELWMSKDTMEAHPEISRRRAKRPKVDGGGN